MPHCRQCDWEGSVAELDAYPTDSAYDNGYDELLDYACPNCGSDDIGSDEELDEDEHAIDN